MLNDTESYLTGHWLTDLSNFSALVFHSLPNVNWAGFYLVDEKRLILGPFVGKPACTEIKWGKGVCGTAFLKKEPLIVPDVHEFPGHITCDSASRSEMVIPLLVNGECLGVLDLDSPQADRFKSSDLELVNAHLAKLLAKTGSSLKSKPWQQEKAHG